MAAVGGVFAAVLALPGGASAQTMYQKDANGVLAYSTSADSVVHTIFTDGTNDSVLSINDPDTGQPIKGTPGEWSIDGSRLLVSDTFGDLHDVNPWTGQHVRQIDETFDINRASMSPDGKSYAYGSTGDGARLLRDGESASTTIVDGASDGTAWSNENHLLVTFDGVGLYRYSDPLVSLNTNNSVQTGEALYPINATISRDGSLIAYNSFGLDDAGSNLDVVVTKADGTAPPSIPETGRPLTSTENFAAISPDGKKVAFVSNRQGSDVWAIYVLDIATGLATIVPNTTITGGPTYKGLSWQPSDVPYLAEGEITTAPEIGNTIRQDPSFDMPSGPVTTKWQWQRCTDVVGTPNNYTSGNCVDMPGETGEGYKLLPGDLGAQFRVIRTVTNGAGTDTQASEITEPAYVPDQTPPGVPEIGTKPASPSNDVEPTFTWTGTEGGGTYQCALDNAAFAPCTSGDKVTITTDGPHTFRVKHLDVYGNASDPAEHTWDVDLTKPSTPSVSKQPTGTVKATTATIEFDGDEVGGAFECRVGKDEWDVCTSPVELTGLTEGPQSYSIRQVDKAGNVSDLPALVEWEIDTTPPLKPTITTDLTQTFATATPQIAFTGEDGGTFECTIDDGTFVPCASPYTVPEQETGTHWFSVRQIDAAGNPGATADQQFTVDVTGPAQPAFGDEIPAKVTNDASPSFTFGSDDSSNVAFECRLDGGAWVPCLSPWGAKADLADGEHTFEVRGIDGSDLRSAPAAHTWTIDTKAPAKPVVVKAPPAETPSPKVPEITVGAEEGTTLECSLDDHTWTDCVNVWGKDLELGPHELAIRLKDKAGNVSDHVLLTWTVVAPKPVEPETPAQPEVPVKPETPQTPAVQAPAVETPVVTETPKAPAATPKAETAAPAAKPKLTALIGGSSAGTGIGTGNGSGTNAGATITVKNDGVGVGCSITGTVLTSCTVDLYAAAPATGATARAAAAKQVLVGTGTYRRAEGSKKLEVDVSLNATGRALMRKSPNGLKVAVRITGTPVKGEKLEATGVATLVRQRVSATVGGFAVNSAQLTSAAKRQLTKLAKQVRGTAVAVRVVGHTDGSTTDADYLKGLGKRRARTVAAYLRAHGVKAKATLVSRGSTQPRATNSTQAGRAKNRRVELRIDR